MQVIFMQIGKEESLACTLTSVKLSVAQNIAKMKGG